MGLVLCSQSHLCFYGNLLPLATGHSSLYSIHMHATSVYNVYEGTQMHTVSMYVCTYVCSGCMYVHIMRIFCNRCTVICFVKWNLSIKDTLGP